MAVILARPSGIAGSLPIRAAFRAATLQEPAQRSSVTLLVLPDPHAIRHIRRRAENHMITRLQSRTNVDAGAVV
jgi:hypothetical protein